jgi:hypothetical protein
MKNIWHFCSLLIFACSCSSNVDNEPCNVADPLNDLPWLKAKVQELEQHDLREYFYVDKAYYNGIMVFVFADCCPTCNTVMPMYNCEGEFVKNFTMDLPLVKRQRIWTPEDSACPVDITHG